METEPTSRPANVMIPLPADTRRSRWDRPLALATAVVFSISAVFPVVAGFVTDREAWPKWWGVLDITIAFVLATLAFAVLIRASGKIDQRAETASYRAYRVLTHGILVVLAAFVLLGDRIVWSNCVSGLAWRYWLLLYSLPAWTALFRSTADSVG